MIDDKLIIIILLVISFIIIFFVMKKRKEEKRRQKEALAKRHKKIENKPSTGIKNLNTMKNDSIKKGNILDPRTIIEPIKPSIKKPVNWKISNSYEEDLKDKNDSTTTLITEVNITILVVDDALVMRRYLEKVLLENNYKVILKNDGVEALDYLKTTNVLPDFIISDIEMPNLDGFGLITKIKEDNSLSDIPILVISAHADKHLILMENESIQGFIKKPSGDNKKFNTELLSQIDYILMNY